MTAMIDEAEIDRIFAPLESSSLPGAAVGIALHGKPVYRKGFGLASMELPQVLTPSTRIRIGSATKPFTCFAYMLLCEQGLAGIDDPVGRHLPELNPAIASVTMRQLMGNTSGIRDALALRTFFGGMAGAGLRPVRFEEFLVLYGRLDEVSDPPGTTWRYNNGGFALLSGAIEKITGRSYEEAMRMLVFEPLGMHDSLVRRWDNDFVANCATGHDVFVTGHWSRDTYGFSYDGGGAIVSTIDDMLRWLANVSAHRVGSPASWALMSTAQQLANGTSTDYGLALWRRRYRGAELVFHGGAWIGTRTEMIKVPEADLDIVIMANRDDFWTKDYAFKIIDACVPGLSEPEPFETRTPPADGVFRSRATGRVVVLDSTGEQQHVAIDGSIFPMAWQNDALRPSGAAYAAFKKAVTFVGDTPHPDAVLLDDYGNVDRLDRVARQKEVVIAQGTYRSQASGIALTFHQTGDEAIVECQSPYGATRYGLNPLGLGLWKVTDRIASGVFAFETDGAAVSFSDGGNRNVRFERG